MRLLVPLVAACLAIAPVGARAALKPGADAPDFSAPAAMGGQEFPFSLAKALERGPVVLYFYPKSFTPGCTVEAHEFAENNEQFAAAGASLLGVSADPIETQREFSTKECRDTFPVAADPNKAVIDAYEARRAGSEVADRISYVVTPDRRIAFVLVDRDPRKHVADTLAFVRKWREDHSRRIR
jgi:peroxiredoxin